MKVFSSIQHNINLIPYLSLFYGDEYFYINIGWLWFGLNIWIKGERPIFGQPKSRIERKMDRIIMEQIVPLDLIFEYAARKDNNCRDVTRRVEENDFREWFDKNYKVYYLSMVVDEWHAMRTKKDSE